MAPRLALALVLLAVAPSTAAAAATDTTINPVRKVVTLLQKMQKAVQEEGEREQELFDTSSSVTARLAVGTCRRVSRQPRRSCPRWPRRSRATPRRRPRWRPVSPRPSPT
ncbi:unnamed protein product [Prorocentrum cordatum]|uniref:Uncharacterized protein n=1 Tax=Prorocentrum cordatum TaxID=2364126 RepID=A0ABN9UV21_9DINO|nr:unnamed protein product [Polarella glacialis]